MSMGKALISVERGPQHQRVIHVLGIVQGQFTSFWIGPTLLGGGKEHKLLFEVFPAICRLYNQNSVEFPGAPPTDTPKV